MDQDKDKIRVGSTPNLKYVCKDPRGAAVSLIPATLLEIRFIAPSGGTNKTGTPVLFSGTVNELHFQTLVGTFDAAGLWVVAIKATFSGGRIYESNVDEIHVDASQFP